MVFKMPIRSFLRGQTFDSDTIEAMSKAFVNTCETLGLANRDDQITEIVAAKIIELAQNGYRNPTAIYFATLEHFKANPQ